MLKPTNRRSYKEVCSLYEARGLTDYRLRTAEDVKAIHNFDLTETEGYSDLSVENKELFIKFMINFMNGQGMNLKITVFPRSVHFVRKTTFLKECPPDPEDGKIYKEEIGVKFTILKANGRTKVLYAPVTSIRTRHKQTSRTHGMKNSFGLICLWAAVKHGFMSWPRIGISRGCENEKN